MDLISLVIVLVVVGVVMWAINMYVPMQPDIKNLLNIVVVLILVVWILSMFIGYFPAIHVGR